MTSDNRAPRFTQRIFVISILVIVGGLITTMDPILESGATTETGLAVQNPGEISAMMTQASEEIQNELGRQGEKLRNQLTNTFGFNEIQSQLSLGYQFSFAGNISGAISHVRMADSALENTITSVLRSGQELTLLSVNNTLALDNNTREILAALGSSLTDLGDKIREQRTSLIGMLQ